LVDGNAQACGTSSGGRMMRDSSHIKEPKAKCCCYTFFLSDSDCSITPISSITLARRDSSFWVKCGISNTLSLFLLAIISSKSSTCD
jgi:hypothetical protein